MIHIQLIFVSLTLRPANHDSYFTKKVDPFVGGESVLGCTPSFSGSDSCTMMTKTKPSPLSQKHVEKKK